MTRSSYAYTVRDLGKLRLSAVGDCTSALYPNKTSEPCSEASELDTGRYENADHPLSTRGRHFRECTEDKLSDRSSFGLLSPRADA